MRSLVSCRFLNSFFDGLEYEPIEAFCKVTGRLSSTGQAAYCFTVDLLFSSCGTLSAPIINGGICYCFHRHAWNAAAPSSSQASARAASLHRRCASAR